MSISHHHGSALATALLALGACVADDSTAERSAALARDLEPIPDPDPGPGPGPGPNPSPCTIQIITAAESPETIETIQGIPWGHATALETPYGFEADLVFSPGHQHFTIVLPAGDPGGASEPSAAASSFCSGNLLFLRLALPMPLTVYATDLTVDPDPDPDPEIGFADAAPPARQREGRNVEAGTRARSALQGTPGDLPPGSIAPAFPECSEQYEWELYEKGDYDKRDVYTSAAPGTDEFLSWARDAIAVAGKAVKTVDNISGVLPDTTQWGPVLTKPGTNRKHMSLGHGNKSLAHATTNDTLVDNSASTQAAGKATGAIDDVEWFHCCTGARFNIQIPAGGDKLVKWPDHLLRAYRRAMPAAAKVAGYDQVVAASKGGGEIKAKLWRVKDHNKRVADGTN